MSKIKKPKVARPIVASNLIPSDPDFAQKTARALDLYQGVWNAKQLRPNDYVISADEKISIQA